MMLDTCPTIRNTDVQLGLELQRLSRLPTNDRADIRLADADNAIRDAVRPVAVHILPLIVDGVDGVQAPSTKCSDFATFPLRLVNSAACRFSISCHEIVCAFLTIGFLLSNLSFIRIYRDYCRCFRISFYLF